MFLILKLLVIIFSSETNAYITQNIETTLLPAWNPTDAEKIALTMKVFGRHIQLNLRRNDEIISSTFKIWKHDAKGKIEQQSQVNASNSCYYHHKDHISSAIINFCHEYGLEGIIFLEDDTLEIMPLQNDSSLIDDSCVKKNINISFGKLHLIKRSVQLFADTSFNHSNHFERKHRVLRNTEKKLYIELAIFVDEPAYRLFVPFLNRDNRMLIDLIITYVTGLQAVFRHPSLGVPIEISLTHLDIFETQPLDLPLFNGNSKELLNSFCKYSKAQNPSDDNDPDHWDIGLYITGLDLYEIFSTGEVSFLIEGISRYNCSCKEKKSCAVAEFGAFAYKKRKSLARGFGSIHTAAHEIGHCLGMHDELVNDTKAGYIMGSVHSSRSKTSWSANSRQIAEKLWQTKHCLRDRPNSDKYNRLFEDNLILKEWKTAKKQCELFFRDRNANVVTMRDVCTSLQCETPFQIESFFAGAALNGTYCASGKECLHGECKSVVNTPNKSNRYKESNWTAWMENPCKSECLEKSKGVIVQRRYCRNRTNLIENCRGLSYDMVLCDDSMLCNKKRMTINEFIDGECSFYSHFNPDLNILAKGLQLSYDDNAPWRACSIYCRLKKVTTYQSVHWTNILYPYLPHGTWCHSQDGQNYYCRKHYCVSENYQFEQN